MRTSTRRSSILIAQTGSERNKVMANAKIIDPDRPNWKREEQGDGKREV
jgi:hypothetical protein